MIAGIDYSLTSPGVCVCTSDMFSYDNCDLFFLSNRKFHDGSFGNITGFPYPDSYTTDEQRYDILSNWTMTILNQYDITHVYIEGYAYNATGQVFNIAENTGVLKHKLHKAGIPFTVIAPTVVKKLATGKGNANKELIYESFLNETSCDIKDTLSPKQKKVGNPTSDLVDAFYICKFGYLQGPSAEVPVDPVCSQTHS
jgi:Holliday junction resolvasome RuvABC endonuclease subunit